MSTESGKRIAFYGGSFDPVHVGHLEIARRLGQEFEVDEFVFIPAFHAPHKRENKPASPFHRFAMLASVTDGEKDLSVSTVELDAPDEPYSIQTLPKLKAAFPEDKIFFVIGADSWEEITTWRRWEEVLTIVNIIVVTRPGYEIGFGHVTEAIRERVVDLRGQESGVRSQESEVGSQKSDELQTSDRTTTPGEPEGRTVTQSSSLSPHSSQIFITDSVFVDVSATEIRRMVREGIEGWKDKVPEAAARHIEKYGLYK